MPTLRILAERTEVAGVVTQPDRPAGRGQQLRESPVKQLARERGLRVLEPARLAPFAAEIANDAYDLFVLASYGRILPRALLEIPRLGSLNVHPSLLPRYRGATPIQSVLRDGERETGVSVMLMDAGLDTGDLVAQRRVAIEAGETYGELHDRLAHIGAELVGEALALAERDALPHEPQRGEATLTQPLRKDDLTVDLTWPAERIVRHVRALSPQPAARAILDGELVKILRAHVAADGTLAIDELIAPNRGRMSADAYWRSRRDRA